MKTIRVYLYALLPYFTWLDTDKQKDPKSQHWYSPPHIVRQAVEDYLIQQLNCQIQSASSGYQLIRPTAKTNSQVRILLGALKCFYKVMKLQGYYQHQNPLVDGQASIFAAIEEYLEQDNLLPRMPDISGVQEPDSRQRLTDSYYKLVGEEWIPRSY